MGEDDLTPQQAIVKLAKDGVQADIDLTQATEITPSKGAVVTNIGTPAPLMATETFARMVLIQAKKTNTGDVYIGPAAVDSSCPAMSARESLGMIATVSTKIDLNKIYIDVDVNGEGVTFLYWG